MIALVRGPDRVTKRRKGEREAKGLRRSAGHEMRLKVQRVKDNQCP